jgi:NADH-quinone oxidoreductase subunit L
MFSFLALLTILLWAAHLYLKRKKVPSEENVKLPSLQNLIYHKYYMDEIYDFCFVKPYTHISLLFSRFVEDKGINAFVNGIGTVFSFGSERFRKLQSGSISFYVFAMIIGILAFLVINLVV